MVRNFHTRKRQVSKVNRHLLRKKIPDKIVVENSKISYAQYFIIPSIFTFVGIQYFKQSNYNPVFLILILIGGLFGLGLNIFLARKFRKNPEIVLNGKGITFSNTRTVFWKEIKWYHLKQQDNLLQIYVECEDEKFFLEFKNLPISKVKLKVLINSFYKKYCNNDKSIHKVLVRNVLETRYLEMDKYLENTIL